MNLGQARDLHCFHTLFLLHQDQADALKTRQTRERSVGRCVGLLLLVGHAGTRLCQALAQALLRQSIDRAVTGP